MLDTTVSEDPHTESPTELDDLAELLMPFQIVGSGCVVVELPFLSPEKRGRRWSRNFAQSVTDMYNMDEVARDYERNEPNKYVEGVPNQGVRHLGRWRAGRVESNVLDYGMSGPFICP